MYVTPLRVREAPLHLWNVNDVVQREEELSGKRLGLGFRVEGRYRPYQDVVWVVMVAYADLRSKNLMIVMVGSICCSCRLAVHVHRC